MAQLDLFSDAPVGFETTAIYPNRLRDKHRVEQLLGLNEWGDADTQFLLRDGRLFAIGYRRIVYGDHGGYLEFNRSHLRCDLVRKFNHPAPVDAFYEWLMPVGDPDTKVYDQWRDVRELANPPPGGFRGDRAEGYADYRPGYLYVSPFELRVAARPQ